jgi:hypothetical protein
MQNVSMKNAPKTNAKVNPKPSVKLKDLKTKKDPKGGPDFAILLGGPSAETVQTRPR